MIFLWRDGENKNWWSCFTVINQTAETIIYSYPLGNIHCRWTYFLKIFFIKLFLIILPLFAMYPKWKKYQYNYLSTFLILPSVINQSWTPTQCLSELISYFYIEKKTIRGASLLTENQWFFFSIYAIEHFIYTIKKIQIKNTFSLCSS